MMASRCRSDAACDNSIQKYQPAACAQHVPNPGKDGLYWDNGKENVNYYSLLGLYRDNGKENGNYYAFQQLEACMEPAPRQNKNVSGLQLPRIGQREQSPVP